MPTVELAAGSNLIVYAVGNLEEGSFTFYTQEITGLGGNPTAVNTGDAIEAGTGPDMALVAAAGGIALIGAGVLLAGRRVRS